MTAPLAGIEKPNQGSPKGILRFPSSPPLGGCGAAPKGISPIPPYFKTQNQKNRLINLREFSALEKQRKKQNQFIQPKPFKIEKSGIGEMGNTSRFPLFHPVRAVPEHPFQTGRDDKGFEHSFGLFCIGPCGHSIGQVDGVLDDLLKFFS